MKFLSHEIIFCNITEKVNFNSSMGKERYHGFKTH